MMNNRKLFLATAAEMGKSGFEIDLPIAAFLLYPPQSTESRNG